MKKKKLKKLLRKARKGWQEAKEAYEAAKLQIHNLCQEVEDSAFNQKQVEFAKWLSHQMAEGGLDPVNWWLEDGSELTIGWREISWQIYFALNGQADRINKELWKIFEEKS